MDVSPCRDTILAAKILLDSTKKRQKQASLDKPVSIDCWTQGMHQMAKLRPFKFLQSKEDFDLITAEKPKVYESFSESISKAGLLQSRARHEIDSPNYESKGL